MKKLLVRCDDFGSASGANEAILRLAELGLKINVSVMICGPAAKENLENLARYTPHLGLGIHAVMNAEWDAVKWGPVGDLARARAHGLVDAQDHFHSNPNKLRDVPPEIVLEEVRAQIQEALNWGIPFSYLDEHMVFSWVQNLSTPLADLAAEFGLIYRPTLPNLPSEKSNGDLMANWRHGLKSMDLRPHLLVTHPVRDDTTTRAFYIAPTAPGVASRNREAEFDALASATWQETLAGEKIELITYRELVDGELRKITED